QLLHNETQTANHWLEVLLHTGVDELGARVRVITPGRGQEHELLSQASKGSQSERRFSLGPGAATPADVGGTLTDGKVVMVSAVAADQAIVLDRDGLVAGPVIAPRVTPLGCALSPVRDRAGWPLYVVAALLFARRRRSAAL